MAVQYLDERAFNTGDVIFSEGDTTAEMFIVQEGTVVLTKNVAGREVFLGTQGRGDFFGEMAMLSSSPRHATCVAMSPTRLLALRSGELLIKLRRDPTFALEMVQQMSRRLAYMEEQVALLIEHQLEARQTLAKVMAKAEFRTHEDQR